MLMKWEDLEPGDRVKLTPDMIELIKKDSTWTNKYWIKIDVLTVEKITITRRLATHIQIFFKEVPNNCWILTEEGKIYRYGIIPFELVEILC